jgi:hypothetical protein
MEDTAMLLIIEIALFISAWRKGWRWRALIPVAAMVGAAMVVLAPSIANGATLESVLPTSVIFDIGLIVWLAILRSRAPKSSRQPAPVLPEPMRAA